MPSQRSRAPDQRGHAPALPVAAVGKEPRRDRRRCTSCRRTPASTPAAARRWRASSVQIALPAPARVGARRRRPRAASCARKAVAHLVADLEVRSADGRPEPGEQLRRRHAACAPRSPRARRRQARASRHAPRPPTEPSRAANSTGRQSATWITATDAGRAGDAARRRAAVLRSRSGVRARARACRAPARASSGSRGQRQRLRARAGGSRPPPAGASPTCAPRFSESNGAALTPPPRSVKAARTPGGRRPLGQRGSRCLRLGARSRAVRRAAQPAAAACPRAAAPPTAARRPVSGCVERQARGVQRLAREAAAARREARRAAGDQPAAAAVDRIADDRESRRAPGARGSGACARSRADPQQRVAAEALEHAVVRHRRRGRRARTAMRVRCVRCRPIGSSMVPPAVITPDAQREVLAL